MGRNVFSLDKSVAIFTVNVRIQASFLDMLHHILKNNPLFALIRFNFAFHNPIWANIPMTLEILPFVYLLAAFTLNQWSLAIMFFFIQLILLHFYRAVRTLDI